MVRSGARVIGAARPWLRRCWQVPVIVGLCASGGLVLANVWLHVRTAALRYRSLETVPPRHTVVVLGASVYRDGRPSDMLRDRLDTALDLYRVGKVQKILLSGDHDRRRAYDEVVVMRRYVLAHGAAPTDVFTDHSGFTTYESVVRAKQIFGVTSAILVTQGFHLPRAVYTARGVGLAAVGLTADRRSYRSTFYLHVREAFARGKAVVDVLLRTPPTDLGPQVSITGDGRATWERDRPPRRK
jgi:vancomycin permeability regulator SanA